MNEEEVVVIAEKNAEDLSLSFSSSLMIASLPTELLSLLKSWLIYEDYRKLFRTSKYMSSYHGKKINMFHVQPMQSEWILHDKDFREFFLSKFIHNSYQQLCLHLSTAKKFPALSQCPKDCSFLLDDATLLQKWKNWQPFISKRQFLLLEKNYKIESFRNTNENDDFIVVQHVIIMDFIKLKDVSGLSMIQELVLINCVMIEDISCLGNVKNLTILNCPKIKTLKGLGRVHTLNLELIALEDISDLTSLNYNVSLHSFNKFVGENEIKKMMESLLQVTQLKLAGESFFPLLQMKKNNSSNNVSQFTLQHYSIQQDQLHSLSHLSSLTFLSIHQITSIDALISIPFLSFTNCQQLSDLSAIEKSYLPSSSASSCCCRVQMITITSCYSIADFHSLRLIPSVSIIRCDGLKDTTQLILRDEQELQMVLSKYARKRLIRELCIAECENVSDVANLGQCYLPAVDDGDSQSKLMKEQESGKIELHLQFYRLRHVEHYPNLNVSELLIEESFSQIIRKDTSWLQQLVARGEVKKIVILNAKEFFPLCFARFGWKKKSKMSTSIEETYSADELKSLDFLCVNYDVYLDTCQSPPFAVPRKDNRITLLRK